MAQYLQHIGFISELERRGWVREGPSQSESSRPLAACLPVTSLATEHDAERAGDALREALTTAGIPSSFFEDLFIVASELSQNAREHGSECYVVAQTYTGATTGKPGVHLAVADFGLGFAASLKPRYGKLDPGQAIIKGFEDRVSGTGQPERGFGLGYSAEAVDRHIGAELHIISRKGMVERRDGTFTSAPFSDFRGTLASAYFPYKPPTL